MSQNASQKEETSQILELTGRIVAAHVSNNVLSRPEVSDLIGEVFAKLQEVARTGEGQQPQEPAVPVRKSVNDDYLICLEDGKKLKLLKRHLKTVYGMTPDEYRSKWQLPSDYPMVAPAYARKRQELAREIGLGKKGTE